MPDPESRRRAVIHVGAHKTGTTFLQNALKKSRGVLEEHDAFYLDRAAYWRELASPMAEIDAAHAAGNPLEPACAAARERMQAVLGDLLAPVTASTIILSNEVFAGTLMLHCHDRLYPVFEQRMALLVEVFEGFDIHFAFSVADQASFLEGAAIQVLRQGVIDDPATVIDNSPLTRMSWMPMIDCLDGLVGPGKVCILDKSLIRISPREMTRRLVRFAVPGVDPDRLSYKEGRIAANPGLSPRGIEIARAVLAGGKPDHWEEFRELLNRRYAARTGERARLVKSNVRDLLSAYYAGEMAAIRGRVWTEAPASRTA